MASIPQTAPGNDLNGKSSADDNKTTARTETEKESDSFLDRETAGQVFDDNSGQQMADMMDDSMRSDMQAPMAASSENVPDELARPSEASYTLPETQHQGKTLTAEGDDK
ncbi:hypothetical protein GKZ68_06360 [Hymenobacter sp. BRD128]|uniref:hypothetical protein n=1 Tax=Hymenobacter sp. BRD128 TaxID=2675878 RepID=UPI0015669D6F|nr:hypothetical protein [Hymenobacter sp. BRD128]QKG56295.1 hypothetical protein GKZ68_06360 [Hymenobacter sp. BRD128]